MDFRNLNIYGIFKTEESVEDSSLPSKQRARFTLCLLCTSRSIDSMSEETHDALDLLKAATSSSTLPTFLTAALEPAPSLQLAAYISFTGTSPDEPINLAKDSATRFTSKVESRDEFYTLGQIWVAWVERNSGVREYLMKGQAEGVGYVSVPDRRLVVEYLSGESDGVGRVVPKGQDQGENLSKALVVSADGAHLCRWNGCDSHLRYG